MRREMSLVVIAMFFTILEAVGFASEFDSVILGDHPVLYLPLWARQAVGDSPDISGGGRNGVYWPRGTVLKQTVMPNGDGATVFDGKEGFVEVASNRRLSVVATGILTLEAWIRPDTLQFSKQQGDGYVYWAGKGEAGEHEYALRMYSAVNEAVPSRASRISGYAFNLEGGLGSGSYFQEAVHKGEWIHVALVINTKKKSQDFPTGYVRVYKNGVLKKTTALDQFEVVPEAGVAPLRIGTRDKQSFFQGAIAKFAVFNYELTAEQLKRHVRKMNGVIY